jgi:hypothetical protein
MATGLAALPVRALPGDVLTSANPLQQMLAPLVRADDYAWEQLSPAAKAASMAADPSDVRRMIPAGLTAFIPLPTRARVLEQAARIKERLASGQITKKFADAELEKLGLRSAVGEAAQRYRIGMKRARSDEGLTEAVGSMGTVTGKYGGTAAHPFEDVLDTRPYGGEVPEVVVPAEITPERWTQTIEQATKQGLPGESTRNYSVREWARDPQEAFDSAIQRHLEGLPADFTPTTVSEAMREAGEGGYATSWLPRPTVTQRRIMATRPLQVANEDVPLLLNALARAERERDMAREMDMVDDIIEELERAPRKR